MSSPEAFGDPSDTSASEEEPSSTTQEQDTVVDTIECPNCGYEFTGNYCPECGQEADPSASVLEVIGGFFRELVDMESGFWPTFVGLSLRPGKVLRDYLGGVRAGLISPGRYLLAAVVFDVGVDQFLAWIGASDLPWTESEASSSSKGAEVEDGVSKLVDAALGQMDLVFEGPQTRIVGVLLVTGLLALLLYRLFGDELKQIGEALAVASFLLAHANFLSRGADLLYVGVASLYAGKLVDDPSFLGFAIVIGYVGFAVYEGFGPGWKSILKGGLAVVGALVEMILVLVTSGMVYAIGLVLVYPDTYASEEASTGELVGAVAILGLVVALPLLIHAGVEVYYRYRD